MKKVYRADLMTEKAKARQKKQMAWGLGVGTTLGIILIFLIIGFNYLFGDLPKINSQQELWVAGRPNSFEAVDKNGNTIAYRGPRYGRRVSIDALPAHVIKAFLAIEDARFFEHSGIDFWGVMRAIVENTMAGHTVQGASTITQQLVKNVYLSPKQTFKRKIQEMVLAWQIDSKYSKKDILEVYLNRIYFGQNAYGLEAAAWRYFSLKPNQLSLAQAAMLAGLPKAPGKLSIDLNSPQTIERQKVVLSRMVTAGFINQQTAANAANEQIIINTTPDPTEGEYAYAIDMAQKEIEAIETKIAPDRIARLTIDPQMHQFALDAINYGLQAAGPNSGVTQAALVAMDRRGRILAIIGGRSYKESQFNRATQARRQPGSTFKPIVYAAALEAGMNPNTIKVDKPVVFDGWRPKNFGGSYSGKVTLSSALTRSINTVAAQLGADVGIDKLIQVAGRLGIYSKLPRNLAISLGAGEVTLIDLTRAYGTLANDGVRIEPYLIERVDTTRNTIAYERPSHIPTQVYDPLKARQMTAMLSDVIAVGTGKRAQLKNGREAAGKTGTSQNFRDAWFIGYTSDIICGVWVGNDEFKPMRNISGGTIPAIIWSNFMNNAHEGLPLSPLPTVYDIGRPDNKSMAQFYQSLATMFEAAGGNMLKPLGNERTNGLQAPAQVPIQANPQAANRPKAQNAKAPLNPAR
jgi:penicillin-binding protein 1A